MLDSSILIAYLVVGTIGWIIYKIYIWPYYISPLRNVPGPPSDNPFYGNVKRFFTEEAGEPQLRWINEYGSVTIFHGIFNKPVVSVSDAKILQEIMFSQVYQYTKPIGMMADLVAILGKGLVLVEGEAHKRQRKMMTPAFSHNNIKEMVPALNRVASTLKNIIEDKVDKGESNVILSSYISKATLDVIGLVGFNYEFNSLTSQNELAEAYDSIMNSPATPLTIAISILSNYIPFLRKIPIEINKIFCNSIEVIERVSKELIKEKRLEVENNKSDGKDLLSLLININETLPAEEKMTDDELKYQIMTFLAAGHDTTSSSTSWALCLLAQHPREQDLLREELVKAFPDKSKFNPTFEEINSLEYLNCIVKETLRLVPPVVAIGRCPIEDTNFNGYFIPKNTQISIPIAAIHKLPSIWGPNARDFDPKRWINPTNEITNFNYLPFISGTRSCIGSKLATTEFKILLSTLIRNFVFQPVEGLHIRKKPGLISKPDPYLALIVSKVEA